MSGKNRKNQQTLKTGSFGGSFTGQGWQPLAPGMPKVPAAHVQYPSHTMLVAKSQAAQVLYDVPSDREARQNPLLDEFFTDFDSSRGRFVPTAQLRSQYPPPPAHPPARTIIYPLL